MSEEQKQQFASEIVDLPSGGKIYGKDSPLFDGKIELKYMTAKEEDILTSQNLIKKGLVLEKLIDSLILTPGVTMGDLITGDKNAVMVAARILAYGPEYEATIKHPDTQEDVPHVFNLADCPFKELPEDVDYTENKFELELPVSKTTIGFKILTGKEEKEIEEELKGFKKIKPQVTPELTTRLKKMIISVDGESSQMNINNFVDNMLSRDSIVLRNEINRIAPDIDMVQEVEVEGESVRVNIPMTINFFWPNATT